MLVGIWSKILEFNPSCQVDLVKDAFRTAFAAGYGGGGGGGEGGGTCGWCDGTECGGGRVR